MMLYALLTAISMVVLLLKLPTKMKEKLLRQQWLTDLIITVVVIVMFTGTFSGMLVGVMSGLLVSMALPVVAYLYFRPRQLKPQQPKPQPKPQPWPDIDIGPKETITPKIRSSKTTFKKIAKGLGIAYLISILIAAMAATLIEVLP